MATSSTRARRARPAAAATLALAAFAAAMTRQDEPCAVRALRRARSAGAPRRAAEEAALMLMLYAGYPCALEGLRVLNETWSGHARRSREGGPADWHRRGRALCRRVYGRVYTRLLPAVEALHPDLAHWMEEQGYGRVLSRPGLGGADRELVTVAALAALGWERQLVSHLLGARRLGATPATIERALRAGLSGTGARAWGAGVRAWASASASWAASAAPRLRKRAKSA
jgi:4-carboxymuconolactone decarboxylase